MTTKRFTLHVDDPTRSTPLVHFDGEEYPSLEEASKAIAGNYGRFHALEIHGRAFVLANKDAQKFLTQEIPFTVGVSNGETLMTLPGKFQGDTSHIRWVDAREAAGTECTKESRVMTLKSTHQEVVFEAIEHPNAIQASHYLETSDHDKVLVIAGRFFTMTEEEVDKVCQSGLQMSVVVESDDIGEGLVRIAAVPINRTGEVPTLEGDHQQFPENAPCKMPESKTPFTDNFFRVTRKVKYFALGIDHKDIFKYITAIDLCGGECCRLRDATGIQVKSDWFIGTLNEPIILCGQCWPKGTLAVFQGMEPGSRFALFPVDDPDIDESGGKTNDDHEVLKIGNGQPIVIDLKQTREDDKLRELQESIELRKKLKAFVSHTNPVPDDDYENHPFYHIWAIYMASATKSHDRAKQALKLQDDRVAFWNAVHAMAAYSAAFVVLEHEDEQIARADAIFAYFDTLRCVREDYPELDAAFGKRPTKQ